MEGALEIILVHYQSPELGEHWQHFFEDDAQVRIVEGDIFEVPADALVSPGNSFGFMDGGLDLLISKKLGWQIQKELRQEIEKSDLGELLLGQAICIEAGPKIVICAPTMRVPSSDGIPNSLNAYLAMKAILLAGIKHPKINSIAIPGLCTGTGRMSPYVAAKQMKAANDEIIHQKKPEFPLFIDAVKHHNFLKRDKS